MECPQRKQHASVNLSGLRYMFNQSEYVILPASITKYIRRKCWLYQKQYFRTFTIWGTLWPSRIEAYEWNAPPKLIVAMFSQVGLQCSLQFPEVLQNAWTLPTLATSQAAPNHRPSRIRLNERIATIAKHFKRKIIRHWCDKEGIPG